MFRDGGEFLVSIEDTAIPNPALAGSTIVAEMDRALATFLGVSPLLCRVDDVDEIHRNPRWKALADNTVRHRLCNYDEMLRECGVDGLLWPDQYARVRKGVDRLVADAMKKAAGTRP